MSDVLEFLNRHSGALSALFSGLVTIATVIYAWLTARLVSETRRMRMAQTEPRVQVTYKTRDEWINLLDLSVRNVGLGPAHDIRFEVRPITTGQGTQNLLESLMKLNSFKNGLRYLGPAQEFSSFWVSLAGEDSSQLEAQIAVTCHFRSVIGKHYTTQHVLDISELKGIRRIGSPPLLAITKHLETIQKDIHSLTTGFTRLRVDTYTQEDRIREHQMLEDDRRKSQERGEA